MTPFGTSGARIDVNNPNISNKILFSNEFSKPDFLRWMLKCSHHLHESNHKEKMERKSVKTQLNVSVGLLLSFCSLYACCVCVRRTTPDWTNSHFNETNKFMSNTISQTNEKHVLHPK